MVGARPPRGAINDRPVVETGREVPRGAIWIYGVHAVRAVLGNPRRVRHRIMATAEARLGLPGLPPETETVARAVLDATLPGAVHQGIAVLVAALPDAALEDILAAPAASATVVVLDQVTDPHNIGAVLRSASAFGALAVVVPDRHSPDATGTLAKAASGALEHVPLVRAANLARALEALKAAGFWCVGLDAEAAEPLAAHDLSGRIALVLGAEGTGMRRLTRDHCDLLARIPIAGPVESLNVSNAAAVALYEIARRRG
ncbi:MAG: 23S rRNA (guanosine(2251)-2'-O)-methyltransferase RlmB [Alphaproteobacteria bacterium]|nr:23S rRNA (guanosine(2251)-2'-O)-methyltransferase RlmB [Alphaproteobacteria bacterium]